MSDAPVSDIWQERMDRVAKSSFAEGSSDGTVNLEMVQANSAAARLLIEQGSIRTAVTRMVLRDDPEMDGNTTIIESIVYLAEREFCTACRNMGIPIDEVHSPSQFPEDPQSKYEHERQAAA